MQNELHFVRNEFLRSFDNPSINLHVVGRSEDYLHEEYGNDGIV